ncbi:DEAD/DEAH box helicase [Candidatus Dojkabacteria bacterium]|uniref:DEAD/DEAH box helicase n=1 Tax=Candidatus Dojkabacteria bacterium TaxID=2099670 RepID=A0A847CZ48_9BACT|nr:DEAD/DEAH box helicase [Candidatus Dojkabacteria bacterium]
MENNSTNKYARNNRYGRRRPSYRSSSYSNSRRGGGYNKRGSSINVSQLIAKAVFEDLPSIYVLDHNLLEFDLTKELKKNITYKKYTSPTKIQYEAIPHILKGEDILGIANTGSGKTAAFLIPMINKGVLDSSQRFLIVVPTRELAMQIQDEFLQLARNTGMRSVLIMGGNSMGKQIGVLKRDPHFVIATPGRLKDLIGRKAIDLLRINNVVLDEVDRMLDMGFIEDIRFIISKLNENKQSLFFSATMNRKSEEIANTLLKKPVKIQIEEESKGKNVDQDVIRLKEGETKFDVLYQYINKEEFKKVLIFTRTKRQADALSNKLIEKGIKVNALHGDKRQSQRSRIIDSFKKDYVNILIATDVASRGLDINNITHVINYDMPENYDDYIHRIGRTGRAGKKGYALTFV